MSWQRIDENTYIDDTLVTCAEYQLFIDETREQGKYYQPDHWISFEFPEGKAREPILGVRQSDAIEFCEWLTKHETTEWQYRIPIDIEATNYQINNPHDLQPVSYWTTDVIGHNNICWLAEIPLNARALEAESILAFATRLDLDATLTRVFSQAQIPFFTRVFSRGLFGDHDFENLIFQAYNKGVDLNFDRSQTIISRIENIPRFVFLLALEDSLHRRLNFMSEKIEFKKLFYEIFIDLYTLQERIAGRSPAFEGIRLVKERIK